jgi:hypothetical protein
VIRACCSNGSSLIYAVADAGIHAAAEAGTYADADFLLTRLARRDL